MAKAKYVVLTPLNAGHKSEVPAGKVVTLDDEEAAPLVACAAIELQTSAKAPDKAPDKAPEPPLGQDEPPESPAQAPLVP